MWADGLSSSTTLSSSHIVFCNSEQTWHVVRWQVSHPCREIVSLLIDIQALGKVVLVLSLAATQRVMTNMVMFEKSDSDGVMHAYYDTPHTVMVIRIRQVKVST